VPVLVATCLFNNYHYDEIGGAYSTKGDLRKAHVSVVKLERQDYVAVAGRKILIKRIFTKGCEGVQWIHSTQDRVQ
jgi:hypothetical protein